MTRILILWRIVQVVVRKVCFVVKYALRNVRLKHWYCWYSSTRTNRLILLVDMKQLHEKYPLQNQFFENYTDAFAIPLFHKMRSMYLEYNHQLNEPLTAKALKKEKREQALRKVRA